MFMPVSLPTNTTISLFYYRGADKSLALLISPYPDQEVKQARKHVRDARDFNNIETRVVMFFFFLQGKGAEGNSCSSNKH